MSRIPRVQTWRVAWYVGAERVDVAYVQAPTKVLAKLNCWAERSDLVLRNRNADRVTYTVCREVWGAR